MAMLDNPTDKKIEEAIFQLNYFDTIGRAAGEYRVQLEVINNTGSTINKGQAVYISGYDTTNDVPEVTKADNDAGAAAMPAHGVMSADIADGAGNETNVTIIGTVDGIDTSSFSENDELYVDSTAGGLTNTLPVGANEDPQQIAVCVYSHATDGIISVTRNDARPVPKVQTGTPTNPTPFTGMFWYDTDATGSSVTSTVNIVTKTGAYTLTADDVVVLANGTFTLTLPTAAGISGKMYWIKNIGVGVITVDGNGAEEIDDGLTAVIANRYASITIISDGTEWWII